MPAAQRKLVTSSAELPPPEVSAEDAGLIYVTDAVRGITRSGKGPHFSYRDAKGRRLKDAATLARIRSLAIPPAWTQVWICPQPRGHLQATGRDARGRKQYRYHARFREVREHSKYDKIFAFADALPRIRARCEADLSTPKLTKNKVLALVVTLLGQTFLRVGNEEYARLNKSFGLTTLRDRHARVRGATVEFRFRGKSGKDRAVRLCDARLARAVKRCQDLPGEQLFQYIDESGKVRGIGSSDVNAYLQEIAGESFTAKDFRTWAGTLLTALHLAELGVADTVAASKRNLQAAIVNTASRLGNTPSVCRKCYIHPAVFEAYQAGQTLPKLRTAGVAASRVALSPDERAALRFLKKSVTLLKGGTMLEKQLQRSLARA